MAEKSFERQDLRNAVDALLAEAQAALERGEWELVANLAASAGRLAEGCY